MNFTFSRRRTISSSPECIEALNPARETRTSPVTGRCGKERRRWQTKLNRCSVTRNGRPAFRPTRRLCLLQNFPHDRYNFYRSSHEYANRASKQLDADPPRGELQSNGSACPKLAVTRYTYAGYKADPHFCRGQMRRD